MPVCVGLTIIAAGLTGCGSSDEQSRAAPSAADFPAVAGRSLDQILSSVGSKQQFVVAPTGSVYSPGKNRFGFGIFKVDNSPVLNAQVAVYAQPLHGGKTVGPFPARFESLTTEKAYEAQSTASDPAAAKGLYVANVPFSDKGLWNLVAVIREAGQTSAARIAMSVTVGKPNSIPQVGQQAPSVHTLTAGDVGGDVGQIDTRVPHDDMHAVDLHDVLGKQPVVLLFATPALCQSRVCGPVVDVAEQVEHESESKGVAFIHQEIYNNNNASDGLRPQVTAYGLRTEPWLFVIGKDGRISTRIEGAFDVGELRAAVQRVAN